MTDSGGPAPEDRPAGTGRRIGPYEQSLIDGRERAEAAERDRLRRRRRHQVFGSLLAVVLVAGVAVGAWAFLTRRDVPTAVPGVAARPTSCADPAKVRVAVAPAVAPAVAAAAQALSKHSDSPCAAYTFEPAEPFAVAGSLIGAGRPDAWITDSDAWFGRAASISGVKATAGQPFATSAVVVAMPDGAAQALGDDLTWGAVLGGTTPVRVPDPNRSTVGRLALGAVAASTSDSTLGAVVSRAAKGGTGTVSLDGLDGKTPSGAVTTEAQLTTWNAAHADAPLTAVAPTEGTGPAQYSLASLSDDAATTRLVSALGSYLHTEEARKILRDSGLRTPGGDDPKEPSALRGTITVGSAPADASVAKAATLWNTSAPKTQALLAVDVSGSMLDRTESGATRLGTVQRATVRATAAVSPTTFASLWVYSLHVGDKADDYKPLVGYGSLGQGQRLAAFDKSVAGLGSAVGGGRGLYDSIAATYAQAKGYWRPGYTNSVVIVTGGPNEDDFGLNLDLLKQQLSSAKDPARPVRLVVVDIGGKADAGALKQVIAITGGQYVATNSLDDLQPALTSALGG
ncbi:substrate-binding domain-containing protein [Intrasporangium sp. YIM S08009]|uniref:substrate-binding domain-containing protein n=1 Tax=Intrasporangium zincisolvens TaxID=3080018 RepID=UPI002B0607BD|nr:substrate-binding domain-containing protein [Intrasporangium sp. YIM S08009]